MQFLYFVYCSKTPLFQLPETVTYVESLFVFFFCKFFIFSLGTYKLISSKNFDKYKRDHLSAGDNLVI
jgi:hypothetical protein